MKGFKTHRHEKTPKEKELHDKFLKYHGRNYDMDFIVFGHTSDIYMPDDYLTDKEKKIVVSAIQWLGSPVGQGFLEDCGFEKVKNKPK